MLWIVLFLKFRNLLSNMTWTRSISHKLRKNYGWYVMLLETSFFPDFHFIYKLK